MRSFAEIGIQLHILCKIMHPSHVPFQAEAQTVILHTSRHLGPGRGFFSDHQRSRVPSQHNRIEMFEKSDSFQIFISAVFIRYPFPVAFSVIQIKHRSNCVNPQTVNMKIFYPEQCVCDQEILHLIFSIIKNLCPPVGMFPFPGIRIFISRRTVKVRKAMGISWKMSRNPVKNNPNLIFMKIIHHPGKILRCSVPGCRSKISCHLISPGTVKGMLGNAHNLNMGISHILNILRNLTRKFPVIIKTVLIVRMLFP